MTDLHIFADVAISPEELFPEELFPEETYAEEVTNELPTEWRTDREHSQSSVAQPVTGSVQEASKPAEGQQSGISDSLVTALAIVIPLLVAAAIALIAIVAVKKKKRAPQPAAPFGSAGNDAPQDESSDRQ